MKILHINTNYNVSTIYKNMVNSFIDNLNFDSKVFYPTEKNNGNTNSDPEFLDRIPCLTKFDRLTFFKRNKKMLREFFKKYDENSFNLILAYSLFSNGYLAYTIAKKINLPYIIIVQNTDVNLYLKKVIHLRGLGKRILKNAYKIVFISKPYKEKVIETYFNENEKEEIRKKSFVIPFGIDDYWVKNKAPKVNRLDKNNINLLYVGKINKNKNIGTTIKVCNYLINQGYNIKYTVVGNIENKSVYNKIKKFPYINYVPFVTKEDLLKIYRNNDIFIMVSFNETFGLVYAEAMSQGLPVIYTKGQGFDQHFRNGKIGYAVDPLNVKEIAQSIVEIIDNYKSIAQNCIELSGNFSWSNVVNKYKLMLDNNF